MIVTDQKISETTPKTFSLDTGTGCGSLGLKTVWTVYSGLVPMSPKTTPRAPSASAPRAATCRFTATVLRLPPHLKPWRTTLTTATRGTGAPRADDGVMSELDVIVIHIRAEQAAEYERLFAESELPRWRDYKARGAFLSARICGVASGPSRHASTGVVRYARGYRRKNAAAYSSTAAKVSSSPGQRCWPGPNVSHAPPRGWCTAETSDGSTTVPSGTGRSPIRASRLAINGGVTGNSAPCTIASRIT